MTDSTKKISDLSEQEIRRRLGKHGLQYLVGPFCLSLRSNVSSIAQLVYKFYGESQLAEPKCLTDFDLEVRSPRSLRRWIKPQAEFIGDGAKPFSPLPLESAFPLLEWGFNWCVATTAHQYLLLHAAVVEKDGKGVLLPAFPGSGKSTLCAALTQRGWRLLSDEFGLVRPGSVEYTPFPRCIPLKNESIGVIKAFTERADFGPIFRKTRKGDVAHLGPPASSVNRSQEPARAAYIIFPRYETSGPNVLDQISKPRAFMKLCTNSFNYEILGERGFLTVADLVKQSECLLCHYSDLDAVVALFDSL